MSIESAIVTRLNAVSGVTDIVDDRINPMTIGQNTDLPCISYMRTGGGPINVLGGTVASTFNTLMQVDCWAESYSGVNTLADAVRTALSGWTDAGATPAVSGFHLQEEEDVYIPPKSGEDTPIYRRRFAFSVWHN